MAVARLADELLQMILAPSLTISHDQFCSPSSTAFGQNDAVSSASVLIVCKRWLRVATPLLYETIVIRSMGQSQAIADVFRRNPLFARYVKNLRLEGAYAFLEDVMSPCTNFNTLVLLLNIYSNASVTSLCRALSLIDPVEVVVRDARSIDNAKIRKVFIALCDAIPGWKNLTTFDYPYEMDEGETTVLVDSNIVERRDHLVDALSRSKSLRTFHAPIAEFDTEPWIRLAGLNVTFKLRYSSQRNFETELRNRLMKDQLSKASVEFIDLTPERSSPSPEIGECIIEKPDFCFEHLSVEAIPDDIWIRIFAYATVPGEESLPQLLDSRYRASGQVHYNTTRKALCLVCKIFERLVHPLIYAFPIIPGVDSLQRLTAKIIEQPSLGRQIHELYLDAILDWKKDNKRDIDNALRALLPHLACLRHFHNKTSLFHRSTISCEGFTLLAETAGETITKLVFNVAEFRPRMFGRFKSLRHLDISPVDFTVYGHHADLNPDTLSTLHTLIIGRPGLMEIFSAFRLPRLRTLLFDPGASFPDGTVEKFLQRSARSIEHLRFTGFENLAEVFRLAPNLRHLDWGPTSDDIRFSAITIALDRSTATHKRLEKLTLNQTPDSERERNHSVDSLFDSLDLAKFPSLKEIHFANYDWPIDERAISRHHLPKKAVQVKQDYGVDVTDQSGKPWRPRVQFKRR